MQRKTVGALITTTSLHDTVEVKLTTMFPGLNCDPVMVMMEKGVDPPGKTEVIEGLTTMVNVNRGFSVEVVPSISL